MRTVVFLPGLLCWKSSTRNERQFKKQPALSLHQRCPVGLSLFQTVKEILTVWRRNQIELVVANGNDQIVAALRFSWARQIVEMSPEESDDQVALAHGLKNLHSPGQG